MMDNERGRVAGATGLSSSIEPASGLAPSIEPASGLAPSGFNPSREEPDMSWFLVAVAKGLGVVILDYADGWKEFGIELFWEDTFACDPPRHLPPGAYRWTGFTIGWWDEDEAINLSGGEFTPLRDSDGSGEAGETGTGSTEGNSADPKGIAQGGSNG